MSGADGGVLVGASVGPFTQTGLDEAFGFTIGLVGVGASKEVTQAESMCLDKELRFPA